VGTRVVLSLDGAIVSEAELTKRDVIVGRYPDCDLVIDHPAVSARHMIFRTVGSTVYAEDLDSTNGLIVNGVATERQVVHHLDVIEIGLHKLHFFDDALLAGGLHDLESTVLTDYERTMIAMRSTPLPAAARPSAKPDDLPGAMAIDRDASPAVPAPTQQQHVAALALQVVEGEGRGETLPLDRTNTLVRYSATEAALVVRRGQSFFVARLAGSRPPRLNGKELGPGTHPIGLQDMIEIGASRFQVVRATRETTGEPQG
jgi:hypothetical protein